MVLSACDERSGMGKSLVLIRIESWRLCSEEISGKRWSWLKESRHNVAIEISQLNQMKHCNSNIRELSISAHYGLCALGRV